MATNLLQPNGFSLARNNISGANTYQGNVYTVKKGYGSNIGKGDPVKMGTGTDQGYIVLAAPTDLNILGIFNAVLPYYDATQQAIAHGLNGSYQSGANPSADLQCTVYDDPFVTFIAQVSGGPFAQSWVGRNINFLAATATSRPGVPNISGISTVALDGTSLTNDNTAPFQIVGVTGLTGGPQDPANTNPWLEVRMNTAQKLATTGV